MTVRELVKLLKTFPQDLPIVYKQWSEFRLLQPEDVSVEPAQHARPDGWVHRPFTTLPGEKPIPTISYLVLPGN